MKNYSRQREAILQVLRSTDSHPTAQWVYEKVRQQLPKISLGTVYRNLAQLRDEGVILGLTVGDGYEHFDGDASAHLHLHCRRCGRISDVVLERDVLGEKAASCGFSPETCAYVICGVCSDCLSENEND